MTNNTNESMKTRTERQSERAQKNAHALARCIQAAKVTGTLAGWELGHLETMLDDAIANEDHCKNRATKYGGREHCQHSLGNKVFTGGGVDHDVIRWTVEPDSGGKYWVSKTQYRLKYASDKFPVFDGTIWHGPYKSTRTAKAKATRLYRKLAVYPQ